MGLVDRLAEIGPYIDMAGGLLYVALALWVLWLRPRSAATITFGIFALFMGSYFVLSNLVNLGFLPENYYWLMATAMPVFLVAGALSAFFPVRPRPNERNVVIAASVVGFALIATMVADIARTATRDFLPGGSGELVSKHVLDEIGAFHSYWLICGYWVLLLAWAWRYPLLDAVKEHRWRHQVQTVSLALILYHSLYAGDRLAYLAWNLGWYPAHGQTLPAIDVLGFIIGYAPAAIVTLIVAAKWLANMKDGGPTGRRRSLILAMTSLGLFVVGGMGRAAWAYDFSNTGIMGIVRAIGVVMIVFTLLRYRLFGLEVRAKFALRGGTLAGLFGAVVFITAEILETVFSIGTVWGSVMAAGAIALALRPLQVVASRFAERVIPEANAADPDYERRHQAEIYEDQLASAARDGIITDQEQRALDRLSAELGLSQAQVAKLKAGLAG